MWGRLPTFFVSERLPRLDVKDALEGVVVSELDAVGFDLVELRRGGTKSRPLIEVRIDRRDGAAVTVDDCARASRALEARLDGSELVSPQYVLQVSSPGERPLRNTAEWRRFVGRWANVVTPEHGGRIEGKILAVEGESGSEVAVLEPKPGVERRIPLADVKEARLAFHL
jgi:ribosome maturation factor RimP